MTSSKRCLHCGNSFDSKVESRKYCRNACVGASQRKPIPPENRLRILYEGGLSTNEIAAFFKVSNRLVFLWFEHYGIPTRSRSEANSLAQKGKPWSEERKKAYRKAHPKVTRPCERCGEDFELPRPGSPKKYCGDTCEIEGRLQTQRNRGYRSAGGKRGRQGKRESLGGLYVRSSWEANVALVLNEKKRRGEVLDWKYEPRTFEFPYKRGNRTYTPDFQVFWPDGTYEWWEVKGYLDNDSKVKLKRFAKHCPEEPLVLVDKAAYKSLESEFKDVLVGWELPTDPWPPE